MFPLFVDFSHCENDIGFNIFAHFINGRHVIMEHCLLSRELELLANNPLNSPPQNI